MSKASLELGGGNWAAKDNGDGTGSLLGYAVGDTSGKYLPREFDFTRGGDLAATRVNEDGLIEKYRENLLLQSNNFGTTWILDSTSVTIGESGYDGTNDAWLLDNTSNSYSIYQSYNEAGVSTFSIYAKQGTLSTFGLDIFTSAGVNEQFFILSGSGSLGSSSGNVISADITDVGSGWYRCSATTNNTGTVLFARIVTGAGTIYIQDAQLEQGLVATDYLESGAATGKAGILDNLPRIDYTGGSAQLLMEPTRTNLVKNSEYLGDYSTSSATITTNALTSPEGLDNATTIDVTSNSGSAYAQSGGQVESVTAETEYTFSFYVKQGTNTENYLAVRDQNAEVFISEDVAYTASTTEWKRISHTFTTPAGCTSIRLYPQRYSSGGQGTTHIWGMQLEAGDYATSYIPTYGASDTRAFDDVDHFDTSVLGFGTTCSIYFEGVINEATSSYLRPVTMFGSGFSTSERFLLFGQSFSGGTYTLTSRHNSGGATNGVDKTGLTVGEKVKCVSVFDGTSQKFFVNGSSAGTDTVPAAEIFEYLDLSNIAADQNHTIEKLQLYPVALSDAECIALTTL